MYKLFADANGNLWIGTWNNGLWLLESEEIQSGNKSVEFECYQSNLLDRYSLADNTITALMVDRTNTLWVGAENIAKADLN